MSATPLFQKNVSMQRGRRMRRQGELVGDSKFALLLGKTNLWESHGVLRDVFRAIWLPSLVGVLFNSALYVIVHHYPNDDDLNDFLANGLISDARLSVVGSVIGFLVVFSQNQYISSNQSLAIYFSEVCANVKAIALLLATMRQDGPRKKHKRGFANSNNEDIVRHCKLDVLMSATDYDGLLKQHNGSIPVWMLRVEDKDVGYQQKVVTIAVPQLALYLVSIPYVIKWKNRSAGSALDLNKLPFAYSSDTKRRFNLHVNKARPALTVTETLLLVIAEDLLSIDGLSNEMELYFQRLIQRIVHLDVMVHALSLYQPPAALGFLFWTLFWIFFALASTRDLLETGWPSVGLNLLYIVGLVGAYRVSRLYQSPFDVSETRSGQLSYVSLEASLTETAVYGLFNLPVKQSQREGAAFLEEDGLTTRYRLAKLYTTRRREQNHPSFGSTVQKP